MAHVTSATPPAARPSGAELPGVDACTAHSVPTGPATDADVKAAFVMLQSSVRNHRSSDPAVFEHFVGFPTRTPEGHPNIRKEHNWSKSSNLSFKFDHVTRIVQSDDTETGEFIACNVINSCTNQMLAMLEGTGSHAAERTPAAGELKDPRFKEAHGQPIDEGPNVGWTNPAGQMHLTPTCGPKHHRLPLECAQCYGSSSPSRRPRPWP